MLLYSNPPRGFTNLFYTPTAIITGESILVTPLETINTSYTIYGEPACTLVADKHHEIGMVQGESAPGEH